jgi:hypothetical protein
MYNLGGYQPYNQSTAYGGYSGHQPASPFPNFQQMFGQSYGYGLSPFMTPSFGQSMSQNAGRQMPQYRNQYQQMPGYQLQNQTQQAFQPSSIASPQAAYAAPQATALQGGVAPTIDQRMRSILGRQPYGTSIS